MTRTLAPVTFLAVLALGLLLAACGTSGSANEDVFPKVIPLGKGDIFPYVNNTSLAVGENRVSISLIDNDDNPVLGAQMHLRFFDLNGDEQVERSATDARFVPVELSYVGDRINPNGTRSEGEKPVRNVVGESGVYVATADFDEPGDWGVLIEVTHDGKTEDPVPYRFNVRDEAPEPAIGDPAPASHQLTLADVADITDIDSAYPPNPGMHDITVANALATGKPLVVFFGTPAFCETRMCNPVIETVMEPLAAKYGGRVEFIHIEPYDLSKLRSQNVREPVPAMAEWGLQTEPWLFVVGADGRVAAKFEGVAGLTEVEEALGQVMPDPASPSAPAAP